MPSQAKPAYDHFTLFFGQLGKPLIDALRKVVVLQQFTRIRRTLVGQGVQQGLVRIRAQRDVHRRNALVQAEHAFDFRHRLLEQVGDFLGRGFMIEFLRQLAGGAQVDVEFLDHMDRQPDGPGLIHDRTLDGLANPPGSVGRVTETAFGVEFLHRSDQAEVALFDQVQQR